jgi:quercetin dioxygenase-like cupin family protein
MKRGKNEGQMKGYITHIGDLPFYVPPGHSKTRNRRLLGPDSFGSNRVEVVLGEIEYGGQADPHTHSESEQAFLVLEGSALVEIEGKSQIVGAGDFIYLPAGVRHRVETLKGPALKLLILYAPPLSGPANPNRHESPE